MQIFIHRGDEDLGPYTVEELQHRLETGELLAEDYAWYEGAPDWMQLEEIPGVVLPDTKQSPTGAHTGLPSWIPPRRTDDPERAVGKPTSFASPLPRSIGITTSNTSKPPASEPTREVFHKAPIIAKATALSAPVTPITNIAGDPEEISESVPKPPRNLRSAGLRNMLMGSVWFVAGSGATLYAHESGIGNTHGGLYLVSWVAVGAGLFQFLRGVNQYREAKTKK